MAIAEEDALDPAERLQGIGERGEILFGAEEEVARGSAQDIGERCRGRPLWRAQPEQRGKDLLEHRPKHSRQ